MGWLTDPIAWWVEPFTDNTFMREALAATVLAVACTSVIGTWVVLRGLAFLGDALAHGVLPGIALAWVIGIDTFGASAPGGQLFEHYGLTVEKVIGAVEGVMEIQE